MLNLKKCALLLLLFFSCLSTAYAKSDRWYRVEVLVFETKDKNALTEDWPADPGKPMLTNSVNLVSDPTVQYGQVADNQLVLTDVKKRIQKNYRLVLHKGWRQPISDKEHAQSVHLLGGKYFGHDEAQADNYHELDGIVRFTAGHYLHVDADLLFKKPMKILSGEAATTARFAELSDKTNWQNQPDVKLQSFRLKEISRLKMDEIQYIDHPMYGVIVMVTPEKKIN